MLDLPLSFKRLGGPNRAGMLLIAGLPVHPRLGTWRGIAPTARRAQPDLRRVNPAGNHT